MAAPPLALSEVAALPVKSIAQPLFDHLVSVLDMPLYGIASPSCCGAGKTVTWAAKTLTRDVHMTWVAANLPLEATAASRP